MRDIHFVGSIGLETAEQVFRTVSDLVGARVRRIPDGETGKRTSWIHWNRTVFETNLAFELDPDEAAAGTRATSATEGERRWGGGDARRKGALPPPRLRIRDGVGEDSIAFNSLGHPHYARESYAVFQRLQNEGIIPTGIRFQVSLPTAAPALNAHIVPVHHHIVEGPLTERVFADVADICTSIPTEHLAIQWDVSAELAQLEGVRPAWFENVWDGVVERLCRHIEAVPASVPCGLHLCYGSYGNRHWMEPRDTGTCVSLCNEIATNVSRPVDWIHLPVPINRNDEAYFAPLAELKLWPKTSLYLGLIHLSDGLDGNRRRMAVAENYAPDFGIATECGFGRRAPETIPDLLRLHALL